MHDNPPFSPLEVAEAVAAVLQQQLDDLANNPIVLTRDEALVTLGLVNAIVENLRGQA